MMQFSLHNFYGKFSSNSAVAGSTSPLIFENYDFMIFRIVAAREWIFVHVLLASIGRIGWENGRNASNASNVYEAFLLCQMQLSGCNVIVGK